MNISKIEVEKRAIVTIDDGTVFRVTLKPPLIERLQPWDGFFVEWGYRLSDEENRELSIAVAKALTD